MTPLKTIRHLLRNWIEDDSIDDIFESYINLAIRECEATVNFSELFATKTVTPSSGVITEPARCREITDIIPYTESGTPPFRFEFRGQDVVQTDGGLAQYTINPYEASDEAEASHSVTFTQGGTTLTQAGGTWFVAGDIGKRVMIDGHEEKYELLSIAGVNPNQTAEVSPKISADDGDTATVAPGGTRRFLLLNPDNTPYEGDVTVKYQKFHPKVFSDESLLLIPCPQSVALLALQQSLMTNKYDVDAQRLEQAVMLAKNRELDGHAFKKTKAVRRDSMFSVRSRR
jgi:hypothetical protein